MEGKTQQGAAAASGMSERSVRTWRKGPLPSEKKAMRRQRTRPDPFAEVWDEEIVPLLKADVEGILAAADDPGVAGRASSRQLRQVAPADFAAEDEGLEGAERT